MESKPPSSATSTGPVPDLLATEPTGAGIPTHTAEEQGHAKGRILAVGWILLFVIPILLMPFDLQISMWVNSLDLPGDIEKDMDAVQQFGQFGSLILVFILIFLLEPPTIRRTLLDLGLAMLIAVGIAVFLKTVLGRTRPWVEETSQFLGPGWGISDDRNWQQSASMPSSHSVAAAVLAVYLAWMRPRLAILAVILAGLVAVWRVRVQAHFASDVAAGLLLGALVATPVVHGHWGVRGLDWIWKRFVNHDADRAFLDVRDAIDDRRSGLKRRWLPRLSARWSVVAICVLALILLILSTVHCPGA